ncbi:hypothetical protein ACQEU3_42430 [Spirillospora sp. CA-253888]
MVAWQDVTEVRIRDGLVIELRDGRELTSIQLGGSLLGYRGFHRAHQVLTAAHAAALDDRPARYGEPVHLERALWWRPPLLAYVAFVASFLPGLALQRSE